MFTKSAEFIISNTDYRKGPAPDKPEFAFIGRSNVGKSSLINTITNRKRLARISVMPGKTQLINHFLIDQEWYLVDLPGLGYAKRSKSSREKWDKMIRDYILKRKNLFLIFMLIDSRIPPQKIDSDFMEWMAQKKVPFSIVFTKTDKLSLTELQKNIAAYKEHLLKTWEELPGIFLISSRTGAGIEELHLFIRKTIEEVGGSFLRQL
jgi:GTP-binding protein